MLRFSVYVLNVLFLARWALTCKLLAENKALPVEILFNTCHMMLLSGGTAIWCYYPGELPYGAIAWGNCHMVLLSRGTAIWCYYPGELPYDAIARGNCHMMLLPGGTAIWCFCSRRGDSHIGVLVRNFEKKKPLRYQNSVLWVCLDFFTSKRYQF